MKQITALEIKEKFLNFFEEHNHLRIKDSSIIPKNDPTLLFINSGMAPLKNFFIGDEIPPSKRLCNVQPCIRTIDLDEVGDKHHLTSFQMLGSWSIGDYFKEDAIKLAYKFLTEYMNIPKEKLYVTIFGGDKELDLEADIEAKKYWLSVGVPEDHIVACPKEDNFWGPTAETGPCGPCTEVFYNTEDPTGEEYKPGGYFDTQKRYIEIWNAGVFMQFNKNKDGSYSKLKFKSVDTGAGLERLAMVLNGKDTVYDTDLLAPIRDKIIELLKDNKNSNKIFTKDILIMTDHLRTTCLILSEKVKPSNEGRGYIPRKLIRKCILITSKANINNFNFNTILEFIIDTYKGMFPNFYINKDYILDTFEKEYKQFEKVIITGLERLEFIKNKKSEINAENAFELVTTFGLPLEIIKDYATENNLLMDENGFYKKLEEHKNISKNISNAHNSSKNINNNFFNDLPSTLFEGYEKLELKSTVLKILKKDSLIDNAAKSDDEIALVFDKTVFYAESGGQCADVGIITSDNLKIEITDVQKTSTGVFLHFGKIIHGEINVNDVVTLKVDAYSRQSISNNHTAVHLLHSALRTKYGQELHQAGSKVEKDRLRFDFNCDKKIELEDIFELEQTINLYIQMNVKVNTEIKTLDDAIKDGAIALFENKYQEKVRMVCVNNISKELCGGTHTAFTGNIGVFKILSVDGIGKGIKRITALTGQEAVKYLQSQTLLIKNISKVVNVKPEKILDKIIKIQNTKSNVDACKKNINLSDIPYKIKENNQNIKYTYILDNEFNKFLRDEIISLSDKINGVVLYVGGENKKQVLLSVSSNISSYQANKLLTSIFSKIGGKGGGTPRVASGGGVTAGANEIISAFEKLLLD